MFMDSATFGSPQLDVELCGWVRFGPDGMVGCDLVRLGSNGCGFWSSLIWLGPEGLVLVSFGLGSSHTVFGLFGFISDCLGLFESV